MLAPGTAFGYERHLRLGIGAQPEIFRTGLNRTEDCLRDLVRSGVAVRG
jgi:hypothetical protein